MSFLKKKVPIAPVVTQVNDKQLPPFWIVELDGEPEVVYKKHLQDQLLWQKQLKLDLEQLNKYSNAVKRDKYAIKDLQESIDYLRPYV
mgnify:CR=1 FL=1